MRQFALAITITSLAIAIGATLGGYAAPLVALVARLLSI